MRLWQHLPATAKLIKCISPQRLVARSESAATSAKSTDRTVHRMAFSDTSFVPALHCVRKVMTEFTPVCLPILASISGDKIHKVRSFFPRCALRFGFGGDRRPKLLFLQLHEAWVPDATSLCHAKDT
jgi:hypothetical protein